MDNQQANSFKEALTKLRENGFDLSKISEDERKMIMKFMPSVVEAATQLAKLNGESSERLQAIITKAVEIYGDQLRNIDLSKEERSEINGLVKEMIETSNTVHREDREWKTGIFKSIAMGAVLVVVAAGSAIAIKNPETRKQVAENAKKAAESVFSKK
ncbi:hypothetical protein [Bacillus sp. 1P06AnD]|uniref:hypothetical protein n=1 Tax=Bacillus sp. 1P06AnD TaxID=3132208 RepID=UPI0039A3147A